MCKLLVSTRLPALVCVTFTALVISASGDDKPQPKPTKVVPIAVGFVGGDQQIMKVLDEPTDMGFVETPLKDVVAAISIRHKDIPIVLDHKAITDAGGGDDTPITFQFKGSSLRSALRLMLHEHDLDFVLSHGALVITSAEKPMTLRKFEVGDLLSNGTSIEGLVKRSGLRCHEPRKILQRQEAARVRRHLIHRVGQALSVTHRLQKLLAGYLPDRQGYKEGRSPSDRQAPQRMAK